MYNPCPVKLECFVFCLFCQTQHAIPKIVKVKATHSFMNMYLSFDADHTRVSYINPLQSHQLCV